MNSKSSTKTDGVLCNKSSGGSYLDENPCIGLLQLFSKSCGLGDIPRENLISVLQIGKYIDAMKFRGRGLLCGVLIRSGWVLTGLGKLPTFL
jgi:hypothetical protein